LLCVAIDRHLRSVPRVVKDDKGERSATAFLKEAAAALPCRVTQVATDNGSCLRPGSAGVCAALGTGHCTTKPRCRQPNGMVERFAGRVGSEVLRITTEGLALSRLR
jgi:transposase InsO family protein